MAIDYDPFCAVCGGPFSHVELLDFSQLGEDEQYLKGTAYDSQLLPADQVKWIQQFRFIAKEDDILTTPAQESRDLSKPADVFISAPGEWLFDERWVENAPLWVGAPRSHMAYTDFLPVHNACLKVLEAFSSISVREFFHACWLRKGSVQSLEMSDSLRRRRTRGPSALPSDLDRFGTVPWSHVYFGARRFWTDPWDCEPGAEYLCADPLSALGAESFISACLAHRSSTQPKHQAIVPHNSSFARCPAEILGLIVDCLSLQSTTRLYASSQGISSLLPTSNSSFWRLKTLRLHPWLWELRSHETSLLDPNWLFLLQTLTRSHRKIFQGAKPWWKNDPLASGNAGEEEVEKSMNDESLPIGLKNRQRIWMCLDNLDETEEWRTF